MFKAAHEYNKTNAINEGTQKTKLLCLCMFNDGIYTKDPHFTVMN